MITSIFDTCNIANLTSENDGYTKSSNDQITERTTAEEDLKTTIVESLGPVVRQTVKHPQHGFTLLSIQDIMARVRNRYGKMRKNTWKNLEEKMSSRLASTDSFETHVSHLREHFLTVEKGGHPILEEKRVEILKKSLSGHAIKNMTRQDQGKNKTRPRQDQTKARHD